MIKRILIFICSFLISTLIFISCGEVRLKRFTPTEYLNNVSVPHAYYAKDSIQILDTLKHCLHEHKGFFHSKEYFDSTQLIIDTIIHNSSFEKFIVFIITKNPTYRQLDPDESTPYYYNATSFIGIRKNEGVALAWTGPNFRNARDQFQLSTTIRSAYFTEISKSDTTWNMNDVRFWKSGIWQKVDMK